MADEHVPINLHFTVFKLVNALSYNFDRVYVEFKHNISIRNNHCTIEDALIHRTGVKTYPWLLSDGRNISRAQWVTDYLPQFEEV